MIRRPPRSTRTDTLFPYTTVFRSHIVRMGLLASGAAHELGTPLSTLSVLIGDWKAAARLKDDPELHDDLADMDAAVQRCKTIVSGILMSAGEARGEAPQLTTMRASFNEIVAHKIGRAHV